MEHVNITFPLELKRALDNEAKKEGTKRSTLIQKAVRVYLELKRQRALRDLMKEGYEVMYGEAQKISSDFKLLDSESLRHVD